jgi:hypothetical protein
MTNHDAISRRIPLRIRRLLEPSNFARLMVRLHGRERAAEIAEAVAAFRGNARSRRSADVWKRIGREIRRVD